MNIFTLLLVIWFNTLVIYCNIQPATPVTNIIVKHDIVSNISVPAVNVKPIILYNYDDTGIMYDYMTDHKDRVILADQSLKLYKTNYKVNGLDFDWADKYMVWSTGDYPYPILMAEYMDKTDPKTGQTRLQVYKLSAIAQNTRRKSRVAIDWVHNLVYYFNYTNLIVADIKRPEISYQLTDYRTPLSTEIDFSTGSLAIHPYESFIVWSEYIQSNGSAAIRRCNEDGSDPRVLVYKDIRQPVCLTIDFARKAIVWIDNELHSLSSIDFDGKNRQSLKQSKQYFSDCSSMDVYNGSVYWASPKVNKIYRLDLNRNPMTTNIEPAVESEWDIDFVRFMQPSAQPSSLATNYCQNASCDHICVPNGHQGYRCLCSQTQHLNDCREPKITFPKPPIPDVTQDIGAVSGLMTSGRPLLLFTVEKRDIRMTQLPTNNKPVHYTETEFMYKLDHYATSINYNTQGNYMIWLKIDSLFLSQKTSLMAAPIDITKPNTLSIDGIEALILNISETTQAKTLAIDWIHNLAYLPICSSYISSKGIYAVNLTAPARQYLIIPHTTCMTKDVRVDPIQGLLFWCEYTDSLASRSLYSYSSISDSKYYIKRSAQNGQRIQTLVDTRYYRKNTLTLDYSEQRLYWLEVTSIYSSVITLMTCAYDGTDKKSVLSSRTLFSNLVISSMDLFNDFIYISDLENDTIIRVTKHESVSTPQATPIVQCGVDIDAIKIVDTSRQPSATNQCLNNRCFPSSLCLPNGQQNYTCYCRPPQTWDGNQCTGTSGSGTSRSDIDTLELHRPASVTRPEFDVLDNSTRLMYVVYKEGLFVKQNTNDLDTNYADSMKLVSNSDWVTEFDYNYDQNCMFWLETGGLGGLYGSKVSLYGAPIDSSRPSPYRYTKQIVRKNFYSKRLAYDWIHGLMYVSIPMGIEVFTITPEIYSYNVVTHLSTQLDVSVDPLQGVLVWSQYDYNPLTEERHGVIMRANQDGSDQTKLVTTARLPFTIAIDMDSQVIYWIDTVLFTLSSVDYDGQESKTIIRRNTLFDETFSMDVFGDYVYWSNYERNAIFMTHKSGNSTDRLLLVEASVDIEGVKVLDPTRQQPGFNRCDSHNCSQLCLPVGREYRCYCSKDSISDCNDTSTDHSFSLSHYQSVVSTDSDTNFMANISLKLDSLLENASLITGGGSDQGTRWVIITLISIAFNLIFILIFLVLIYYNKRPKFPGRVSFNNEIKRVMLDETSLDGDL